MGYSIFISISIFEAAITSKKADSMGFLLGSKNRGCGPFVINLRWEISSYFTGYRMGPPFERWRSETPKKVAEFDWVYGRYNELVNGDYNGS